MTQSNAHKDEQSGITENVSLSPETYWPEVETAYHMVREEGFKAKDFIQQSMAEWKAEGVMVTVDYGDGRLRGPIFHVDRKEGLLSAVRVSEVMGNRLTYAEANDWAENQGRTLDGDPTFGFSDFISEVRSLTSEEIHFTRMCLSLSERYIADAIRNDQAISPEGRDSDIQAGSDHNNRLIALLDAVELQF